MNERTGRDVGMASAVPAAGGLKAPFFDERHDEFRRHVREVLGRWAPSDAASWDASGHVPAACFEALGAAGAFRQRWEGGPFGGLPFAVVLAEETARLSSGLGQAAMTHCEVFLGILQYLARSPAQQELRDAALDGRVIGCFGATETHAGSDLRGVRTVGFQKEDGWRLRGRKRYVSNGGRATHAMVLAKANHLSEGRDLCLFVLPLEAEGVTVRGYFPKLGVAACDTADVEFTIDVAPDALLGTPGAGLLFADYALQLERIFISVQSLTAARTALRLAMAHMRRRAVDGEPVIRKQALRHRLADAWANVRAADALLNQVVSAAMAGEQVGQDTACLKLISARLAGAVVDECMQMVGGRGYTRNYPIEAFWRDVRLARIGGGTDEVMRELIAFSFDSPDPEYDRWATELEQNDVSVLDDAHAVVPTVEA